MLREGYGIPSALPLIHRSFDADFPTLPDILAGVK
jgi:hypothetical protein